MRQDKLTIDYAARSELPSRRLGVYFYLIYLLASALVVVVLPAVSRWHSISVDIARMRIGVVSGHYELLLPSVWMPQIPPEFFLFWLLIVPHLLGGCWWLYKRFGRIRTRGRK